jgi:hypothetical protein
MRRRLALVLLVPPAALAAVWVSVEPASVLRREAPPTVAVTVSLPAPPAEPTPPPAQAESPPPPQVAALPPKPAPAPAPEPEPLVVDRRVIARVQFFLEQLGYQVGVADGVMGKRTKAAIAAFRATNNLGRSEEIDGALFDALDHAVRQIPAKPAEGVPAAAPRVPVVRVPLGEGRG